MRVIHPTNERIYARAAVLLDELEQLPPGASLLAGLMRLQAMSMGSEAAVRATALWDQLTSHCQAQAMVTINEAVEGADLSLVGVRNPIEGTQVIAEELAALTHVPSGSATSRVAVTSQVAGSLPSTWEALHRGDIRWEHLRRFAAETRVASTRVASWVDAQLIPVAIRRGWTPGKLAAEARRAIIDADPEGAADRAAQAKRDADVRLYPGQDETATLDATGDAVTLRRVMDLVNAHAAALAAGNSTMPIGLARFAALADLVLGDDPAARRTEVVLTMDVTTWLGLTAHPGQITGYGPITPETARVLAADAGFRLALTEPITGQLLHLGRTRYHPSAPLRRFVQTRDGTCRFPGCERPAIRCDLDHRTPWIPASTTGGTTDPDNLHALCRRHHILKTKRLWRVQQHPNGDQTWTSALGFTHRRTAASYQIPPLEPPDDDADRPPADVADRLPTQRDASPANIDAPLPDPPTPTLEEYYADADEIEQGIIRGFLARCANAA